MHISKNKETIDSTNNSNGNMRPVTVILHTLTRNKALHIVGQQDTDRLVTHKSILMTAHFL